MIHILLIGFIAACLTLFLNYCMGKPGGEFSPYEIFSRYTVWLSERRLKEVGLFDTYATQCTEGAKRLTTKYELLDLKQQYKKILYQAAEPYFTWERMVGMCPVCFGFWVSLISGFFFTINVVNLVTIVVVSHVTIRLLNKIL